MLTKTVDINKAQVLIHAEAAEYREPSFSHSWKLVLLRTPHPNCKDNTHQLPEATEANLLLNLEEQMHLSAIHILQSNIIRDAVAKCEN